MSTLHPPTGAARPRAQGGYTLIELLLAVGIIGVILVPLFAWVALAIQQQPITRDGLVRSADTGLLAAYLPQDVAVAGAAAVAGSPVPADAVSVGLDDCAGGDGEAVGDAVLALLVGGPQPTKIVYTEAAAVDGGVADPTRMSVWRRECSPDDGSGTVATQVFTDVLAGSTEAECDSPAGGSPCEQVRFETQPLIGGDPIVLSATRRTDTESLSLDATGNRLPIALITVQNQTVVGAGVSVELSGAASVDPDGTIVSYRWVIPTQPPGAPGGTAPEILEVAPGDAATPIVRTFPGVGRYHVSLTVTDDRGAANTVFRRILVKPLSPTSVAEVTPTQGGLGTVFTFTGSGSSDPDGTIDSYRWVLGGDETSAGISYVVDQADWDFTFPDFISGPIPVTLTVTDNQGRSSTTLTGIVVEPPVPDPGPEPEPGEEPPPSTVPGGPVAVFAATQGATSTQWNVNATASTPAGAIASYEWDFGQPGPTATGPTASHTYGSPGNYTVRLTVTDAGGLESSATRTINVPGAPGTPPAPTQQGFTLVWNAVPGARRYFVDFEFIGNGCAREIRDQAIGASPAPSRAIPPNPCVGTSTARARYSVEVNGQRAASPWIDVDTPAASAPGGPGEVVK